jgi:hypothetical protein
VYVCVIRWAADGGMLMPSAIPAISAAELETWRDLSYSDLCVALLSKYEAKHIAEACQVSVISEPRILELWLCRPLVAFFLMLSRPQRWIPASAIAPAALRVLVASACAQFGLQPEVGAPSPRLMHAHFPYTASTLTL